MNQRTTKWSLLLLSLTIALGLAACSQNDTPDHPADSSAASSPPANSASPSATPSVSPSASASPSASDADPIAATMPADLSELPETKSFTLKLEGNEEQKTAKLAKGNGYALYVFDAFTFDANAGKLYMNIDKNYYVEITKLPSGFDKDQLKKDAEQQLSKLGDVQELKDPNPAIGDTAFFVLASSEKLTNQVILKEVDGAGFLFKVNMPHTEANEGFGPHAFVSMSSIVNP